LKKATSSHSRTVNGKEELITHRIVEVAYLDGKANTYFTLGDAQPRDATPVAINPHDVLAVYKYLLTA
jgi:hypothetical protein